MNTSHLKNYSIFFFGALISVYIVFRSLYVPPYADEISTYFRYVKPFDFNPNNAHLDANNHFLNSLLTWFSVKLFGNSMFALRLPNTLAGIGYVVVSYIIQKRGENFTTRLAIFVMLTFSYHLIGFFSLSRGYGLSFTFLLSALWAFYEFQKSKKISYSIWGLFCVVFALWSNLGLMIPVLVILSLLVASYLAYYRLYTVKENLTFAISVLLGVAFILKAIFYSFKLKNEGMLYFGSEDDFLKAMIVNPLMRISNYNQIVFYLWLFSILIYILLLLRVIIKKDWIKLKFQGVFLFSIFGVFVMHQIMGIKYPIDRNWAHFIILFLVSFFWLQIGLQNTLVKSLFLFQAIILLAINTANINLNTAPFIEEEGVPEKMYDYLISQQKKEHKLLTVSAHGLLCKSLNHWEYLKKGGLNHATSVGHQNSMADFLLLNNWDTMHLNDFNLVLNSGPFSLYRRKNRIKVEQVFIKNAPNICDRNEFMLFEERTFDNLQTDNDFKLEVSFTSRHSNLDAAMLTVSVFSGDSIVHFEDILLSAEDSQNSNVKFKEVFILKNLKLSSSTLKVYVWNIEKRKLQLTDIHLRLMKIKERN